MLRTLLKVLQTKRQGHAFPENFIAPTWTKGQEKRNMKTFVQHLSKYANMAAYSKRKQ